jgi:hypothetical protein
MKSNGLYRSQSVEPPYTRPGIRAFFLATLLFSLVSANIRASDIDTASLEEKGHPRVQHGHGSHASHRHHLAALIAATSNLDHHHTNFTLGGDYQYRLASRWAVGGFGEVIFAEHTEYLFGIPLYFFPTERLWLRTGPGVEFVTESLEEHEEHSAFSSGGQAPTTTETKFLFRFGVGYNFELGGLTLTPSLDLDLVRNARAVVWGLNIGKGF